MSDLLNLPTFGEARALNVVVETPRGASVKLKYEPKYGTFTVARALPLGMAYPFDWGFVPRTLAPDGDPLDVMVIHDFATYPGVLLPCRALGAVLLDQDDESGRRVRNDRVIAMPTWHDRLGEFERASDLPLRLRQEMEAFFLNVTVFTGKNARVLGWKGAKRALSLVASSASSFAAAQARA